jgi:hypothetical protein
LDSLYPSPKSGTPIFPNENLGFDLNVHQGHHLFGWETLGGYYLSQCYNK